MSWSERTAPRNVVGHVVLVWERRHIVRETASFALVVCMLFTASTVGYSAIDLFHQVQAKVDVGVPVVVTHGGITFQNVTSGVWDQDQLVFTKALYGQMKPLQTWVEIFLLVVVFFTFSKELVAARSYAKQELRAKRPAMAMLWGALGIRRAWLWDAFLSGRTLALAAGYAFGLGLAILVTLPLIHSLVDSTFVNLFMAQGPGWMAYGLSSLLALAVWDVHAASLVLAMRRRSLQAGLREGLVP